MTPTEIQDSIYQFELRQKAEQDKELAAMHAQLAEAVAIQVPLNELLTKRTSLMAAIERQRAKRPAIAADADAWQTAVESVLMHDDGPALNVALISLIERHAALSHAPAALLALDKFISATTAKVRDIEKQAIAYAEKHELPKPF